MDKSLCGKFLWPDPGRACIIKAVTSQEVMTYDTLPLGRFKF